MATVDMKTLTIGDTTYTPVDEEARTDIGFLAGIVEELAENVEELQEGGGGSEDPSAAGTYAEQAAASAQAAAASAESAQESATMTAGHTEQACNAASAALAAETNAKASENNAATSASTATSKAQEAAGSAKSAADAKTAAESAKSAAETAANTATSKASAANTSATNAANSASAAKTSETNAKTSETNAANSATAANTSKNLAAGEASAAGASATLANNKANEAAASASAAKASETNAANSASSASTSASTATSKASAASTSASNAATSATSAANSASTATSKASAAASSATAAANSATAAQEAADSIEGGYIVPDYWQDAVDAAIEKVKAIQDEGGVDCVQFAAIGDLHWVDRASDNYGGNVGAIAAAVMDACDIPLFVALGDLAESGNAATEQYLLNDHDGAMEVLAPIGAERLVAIRGNHDDVWGTGTTGTAYANKLSPAQVWNKMHRPQVQDFRRVFGGDGTYFYIDNEPQRTRFIALNSHFYDGERITAGTVKMMTTGFGTEQLNWLRDVALNLESGWTAVVFTHVPPTAKAVNGRTDYLGQLTDGATFRNIIGSATADIAAIFCGHCHADAIVTDDLPCPIVTVTVAANIPYDANEGTRTKGTATETAVDFVSINKAARTIKTTRLGIGSDRVLSYDGVEIVTHTVTSNLTNATNSNSATSVESGAAYTATIAAKSGYENLTVTVTMGGANITSSAYSNGVVSIGSVTGNVVITATATAIQTGPSYTNLANPSSSDWGTNKRLGSDGTFRELTGAAVTNWVECKRGDVLRIKGLELTKAYASSNTTAPYIAVSYENAPTASEAIDINSYEAAFPRDASGVYTFTVLCLSGTDQFVPSNGEVTKIRFSGLLSASSAAGVIITKNEPIE